jgi:cytoskeletal protein CcmA (bactofilin family)
MPIHNGAEASPTGAEAQSIDLSPKAQHSIAEPKTPEPVAAPREREAPKPSVATASSLVDDQQTTSVIGADLAISGQDVHIISKGKIRVEGRIQGDVRGTEVVVGDVGTVEGVVAGDSVKVFGVIMGTIRGVQVEIQAGAKVEADIHHQSLSVDAGAQVEGRVRRARDTAELLGLEPSLQDEAAPITPVASQAAPEVPSSRRGRM